MGDTQREAHGLELPTISKPEDAPPLAKSNRKNLNNALRNACSDGNFDAVWMLLYAGAENITNCIHLSIKHEHYKVAALLLICHMIFDDDIPMLENLLKGKTDFKQLVQFFKEYSVYDKVITCLNDKEDFTKVAIQVARQLNTERSTDVLKCLLLNTHCQERYRKVDWKDLFLESFHESWLNPIETWVEDLNLSYNKLASVPRNISNMKSLIQLNLSGNNLDMITREIFSLPSLRHLNISKNNLQKLPKFPVKGKISLKSLNVSDNKLKALPQSVMRTSLEILNLSKNTFTEVPLCVCEITTLKDLDVSHNREISSLPHAMGKLRNLCYLGLKDLDKITDPPKKTREDAQNVVSYLRTKLRSCQPYYTMKLMLVGNVGQGKTTLLHRLQDDYSYNDDNRTQGIEITDLVIKKSAFDKKFNFKVWDFGGQEDYYATHQCFLSTMSLYLLVWRLIDGEEGVNGLTPWLDNIAVRSPGSTVIVVGTHLDCIISKKYEPGHVDHLTNMVYQLARKPRYKGKIVLPPHGICTVSCGSTKSRFEINKLRHVIYDTAAKLKKGSAPVMGELIPSSFFSLIDRIERRRLEMLSKKQSPIMWKDEFHAMVKENARLCKDIEDPLDVRDATIFLRERGITVHFDDPSEGLHDLYFIDPHWLCAQITRVIAVKCHADFTEGIVDLHKTNEALKEDDLPIEFLTQIVRLLIRFQVVYTLDQSRILVPSKLPEEKPKDVEILSLPFVPVRRVYEIDYQRIHGFWTRFMSRLFFYMKEMIGVDPTLMHQKSEHRDGMATFCGACAGTKASSKTFPCFLERDVSKKPKPARKKKSSIARSSSMKHSLTRPKLDSIPSVNDDPSVRIFSEEELGEDAYDDDIVGVVINNVGFGMNGGSVRNDGNFLESHSRYLVLKKKASIERAKAAMALRIPSYYDREWNGDCSERETLEADINPADCFKDEAGNSKETLGDCNQAYEFSTDRKMTTYDEKEFGRCDERETLEADTNPADCFKDEAGNSKETLGDCNQAYEFSTDHKMTTYDEKESADDGRRTIYPEDDPTKYVDDGVFWGNEERCPTKKEREAMSSDTPLPHTNPADVDLVLRATLNELEKEENVCESGLSEEIPLEKSPREEIPREEMVDPSMVIASSSSSEPEENAGESCSSAQCNQTSVSLTTNSPSSRQPEYDCQKSEPFFESVNTNTVDLKGRFPDNITEQPETKNHETEPFSIECFRKSKDFTPDITSNAISECQPTAGCLQEEGSPDGNSNERPPDSTSASSIRSKFYLALDNIDIDLYGSSTGNFIPRLRHIVNSTKDRPDLDTPETSPANHHGGYPLHASAVHINDIDSWETDGAGEEARSTENKKTHSEFPGAAETGVCALCEENIPVNQLVSIPLNVAELMEKNYLTCWRSGMCLNHPNVFLAVSHRSLSDTVVIETAVSPSPLGRRFLTFVVDHLDTLIKEWYPGLLVSFDAEPAVQKLIPCRLCEENGTGEQHMFTFDSCITQCSVGDTVKCPEHEVSIQDIAPDVLLHDLDARFLLNDEEIQYDKTVANKLGGGSFGAVWRGFCHDKPAAIKEFSSSEGGVIKQYSEVRKEVNVMRHIGEHPFLVNLIGVCLRPFRLVLELADKGSLANTLTDPNFFIDRVVVYRMAYQVAEALSFLHSLNVIYRDLKPGNVLVMSYEEEDDVNIKLTDFGTATFQFSEGLFSVQGTTGHHAPEMLVGQSKRSGYNDKVDVFSLGMLIYSFITRRRPFSNVTSVAEINSMISRGEKPKYDDVLVARFGLTPLTWLMEKCLQFNPNLRPTSKMVATQACSPSFQMLLGRTTLPRGRSVRRVCVVEATRELWVAAGDQSGNVILVYELKSLTIKEAFIVPSILPSMASSEFQVDYMHVTTKSVLIGLRGDLVAIHDIRTYQLKGKIILKEPMKCFSSNENFIFLAMSSGLLLIIPTSGEGITETIQVSDDPISSMVAVDDQLWLACKNCIYIYSTRPGENTTAFEMVAIRYSVETSPVTIIVPSRHKKEVWCACKASSLVTCWDLGEKHELLRIDCESALRRVSTNDFLTAIDRCVTCVVPALDTLWLGTGGGMLLIFDVTSGELITWMHVFDDRVRTLTLVSEPGPYSPERCYVIASGGKTREATLSCADGEVVCPLVPEENKPLPPPLLLRRRTKKVARATSMNKLRRTFHRKKPPESDNTELDAGESLLLFEVLPSTVLRRIEAKSPR